MSTLEHRWKPAAAALATLLVAVATAACGREEEPDLVNGKTLFTGKGTCGSCHTLSRANTKGTQGPDLDAAFAVAKRDGMNEETVQGVVRDQIKNVRRGSIMPRDLVTGDDARDVAAYVAQAAAVPGKDTGQLAGAGAKKAAGTAVEKDGTLSIPVADAGLAYVFAKATANAGSVKIESKNPQSLGHDIAIEGNGVNQKGETVQSGGTSEFTADLKPGEYTFYCSVPGHREGGMVGKLTVK